LRSDSLFFASLLLLAWLLLSPLAQAKTLTDIDGHLVTIPDRPQRIVLGESRMLYTLALLAPENPLQHIVGWPRDLQKYDAQMWRSFARRFPQIEAVPSLGSGGPAAINPEQVIALRPDVVILPSLARYDDADARLLAVLQAAHIPVVKIDLRVQLLKNTRRSVEILGDVINQQARAAAFNRFYAAHMRVIEERLADFHGARPEVLLHLHLGRRNECCVTAINGSLGEESVIAAQPDYYFATGFSDNQSSGRLKLGPEIAPDVALQSFQQLTGQQKGLRGLKALHNGQAGALWMNFYLSPWHVVAAEFMAKTLYPQRFADVDPQQTLETLFRDFLRMPLQGTWFMRIPADQP